MLFKEINAACFEDRMEHQIKSVGKMTTVNMKAGVHTGATGVKRVKLNIFVMK